MKIVIELAKKKREKFFLKKQKEHELAALRKRLWEWWGRGGEGKEEVERDSEPQNRTLWMEGRNTLWKLYLK